MKRLTIPLLILSSIVHAQKMSIFSGDLTGLKKIKSYTIKFIYDSISVNDKTEKDYLEMMKKRWDERESGKGDAFIKKWFDDRERLYEPAFKKKFEAQSGIKLGDTTAEYTIILKTKHVEGGWDLGITGIYPHISGEMWIVETADNSKMKARILFSESNGIDDNGGDFDMTKRIRSAYASAGKWLSIFLLKKCK